MTICCIIGAGFLGIRIAGELSRLGLEVKLYDHERNKLQSIPHILQFQKTELLSKRLCRAADRFQVTTCEDLIDAVKDADFIFEAISEKMGLKQWVLQKVTHNCPSQAIVCSNTLSMDLTEMSSESLFKERIMGCRFLTPVYCIPIVEVSGSKFTSHKTMADIESFFKSINIRTLSKIEGTERRLTCDEISHYWEAQKRRIEAEWDADKGSVSRSFSRQESNSHATVKTSQTITDNAEKYTIERLNSTMSEVGEPITWDLSLSLEGHVPQESSVNGGYPSSVVDSLVRMHNQETLNTNKLAGLSLMEPSVSSMQSLKNQSVMKPDATLKPGKEDATIASEKSGATNTTEKPVTTDTQENGDHVAVVSDQSKSVSEMDQTQRKIVDDPLGPESTASECVICNEYEINSVIIPCGHMWLCYECAFTLKNSRKDCPACRQPINSVVRVYKP